ncbi:MAG: Maltodextrin ABC transporter, permease protein MdxF [uncultured Nocardioides sp.]|uniref:Maltodextrin ABC transporter, permease protein MdxF n=1 Tax=uncultured Nocardioides sp. TaxID=198441 RepID=A0A6J4NPH0_9ACTN|nr:MAG: Maltodextrin ABC transporter, permease protein MdxF [uncultured Nocardioides sp.]
MSTETTGMTTVAEIPKTTGPERASMDPHQGRRAWMLIAPTVVLLGVVIGYPVVRAVIMSFQKDAALDPATGLFQTGGFAGVDNYVKWLAQRCGGESCPPGTGASSFYEVVGITVGFTVVTVAIELVLGFLFAMIMNGSFKGRGLLRASVLIPWAIPTAVTAKLWYFIFAFDGVANKVIGGLGFEPIVWFSGEWAARSAIVISDVWKTTPFMALLILAGLQLIGSEIYEAAKVDGASAWQRFTAITLPLVKPAVVVALLFRTLDVLRMYDLPAIMTGGGAGDGNDTTTLSILVVKEYRNFINSAAALSTITFLFIFAVAFIFIRFLGANVNDDGGKR